jgi:pSer/pThr/pTyr-binding forkhead associated (FHA) protein
VREAVTTLAARQGAKLEVERGPTEQPLEAPPQASLLVSRDGKVLSKVTLGPRTLVGRSEHNDVCLPNPYLSRHHAVIVGTPEGYYIVDLNSANGVTLNGRRVERAVLCDQDVLTLGPFRLKIQVPESLTRGSPLPEAESLAETAAMAQPAHESAIWRIK